ncbi:MAG: hypothetical protein JSS45_11300 [Proteobacteria bacterium]|nr:hypothetical protein [Pseudomonadota bacterium]
MQPSSFLHPDAIVFAGALALVLVRPGQAAIRGRFHRGESAAPVVAGSRGVVAGCGASGGSVDSNGSYTRSSDGNWNGNSATSASGVRGSYSGSTTVADGSGSHDTTITNAASDTCIGQTTWTKGQGHTHVGTCTDAQGNVISGGR